MVADGLLAAPLWRIRKGPPERRGQDRAASWTMMMPFWRRCRSAVERQLRVLVLLGPLAGG